MYGQIALDLRQPKMNSVEIADLVAKRHDNVKRTIKTLADQTVIVAPQIEDVPFVDESGRNRTTSAYIFTGEQGRRDSTIVVAQLSPECTARLVDRWLELEEQAKQAAKPVHRIPQTYAEALQLAADQARLIEQQEQQLEAAQPAIEFHERVGVAEDCHTLDEAAKILRVGPNKLRAWLRDRGFMRRDGTPMQEYLNRGYFRVIEKTIQLPHGWKLYAQTYITGKGLIWLQRQIDHAPLLA
jgi:anti-repressor protein